MLLESDHFLLELSKLFQQQRQKNSGSLCLTMKRYDGRLKPKAQLTKKQRLEQKNASSPTTRQPNSASTTSNESVEYKCLVRAVFGSRKLSTIVSTKDINRFQLAYANLLKANMDTLKKKVKETKSSGTTGQTGASQHPSSPTTTGAASPTVSGVVKKSNVPSANQVPSSPSVTSASTKKSTPSKKK